MKHSMLISIIVPVYRVESYLHRCVDSVLAQTYTNWELILVDDGSPDRCPAICEEYAAMDKRIKVIHKLNGGQAEARNKGLDVAVGDYIQFLDSDDYIHPNTLKGMLDVLQRENADIVQCAFVRGQEDVFPIIKEDCVIKVFDNHSIFYSSQQKIILWAKLYRKELWDGIRIPVGIYYEDDASTWKLYYRSRKTVVMDVPYYYYYINPNSTMAAHKKRPSLDFIDIYQERIDFFVQKNEQLLVCLSQWRFCMPLMLIYMRGNITKDEKGILLRLFRENVESVVCCKKVPFKYRALMFLFNMCPQTFRAICVLLGKARTVR